MTRLDRAFFARHTVEVARDLLGCLLVRQVNGTLIAGRIVETEAYFGQEDAACHGYRGKTRRAGPLFEEPGRAYVYLIYGMYWLANVVAKPPGLPDDPGAVLFRALEPVEGLEHLAANRPGRPMREWTSGPGRLTQALGVDDRHHRLDLTAPDSPLYLMQGERHPGEEIESGPRVGLGKAVYEPWLSMPWRFWIAGNPHVSKRSR
jgi:DNA-3-methyladenine glycosylase